MNGKQVLEMLARLPARVWLQAAFGIIGFIVLAVLGFAVIAGVAVVVLAIILAFKAKAWIAGLFGQRPAAEPPPREMRQVTDVPYEIVEKKDEPSPR
ncbi:MAG: hypothetical protein PSV46_19680 [Reyranella sp.]|nr:hypothetical protein [Reyranella sp.]